MVLHEEGALLRMLMYNSKTVMWNKRYKSKAWSVQIDNLNGELGVKRFERMMNKSIKDGSDERS